jgi:hypothetical protein
LRATILKSKNWGLVELFDKKLGSSTLLEGKLEGRGRGKRRGAEAQAKQKREGLLEGKLEGVGIEKRGKS